MDATSVDTAKIKTSEMLTFGSNVDTNAAFLKKSELLRAGVDKSKQLQEIRDKGGTGFDVLARAREKMQAPVLTGADYDEMKLQFGARHAKKDQASGNITPNVDDLPDAEAAAVRGSYERAEKTISEIQNYLDYTDILTEMQRTGKKEKDILPTRNISETQFTEMKNKTLDTFFKLGVLHDAVPELASLSVAHQKDLVEKMLVQDPALRARVAESIRSFRDGLRDLPAVASNTSIEEAKKTVAGTDKVLDEQVAEVIKNIVAEQIPVDEANLTIEIKNLMKQGASLDTAVQHIHNRLLANNQEVLAVRQARAELQKRQDRLLFLEGKLSNTRNSDADTVQKWRTESNTLDGEIRQLADGLRSIPPDIDELDRRITAFGTRQGQFAASVTGLTEAANAIKRTREAERLIKQKQDESEKTGKELRDTRLKAEGEKLQQLEGILATAVLDTLEARGTEMTSLEQKRIDEKVKKENGDAAKKVGEAMKKNWRHVEERRGKIEPVSNYDRIASDMKFFALHGETESPEMAIKRLMIRDLGLKNVINPGTPAERKDSIDYKTVDIDALTDEQKAQLNSAYAAWGEQYSKKLMDDFFLSRAEAVRKTDRQKLQLEQNTMTLLEKNNKDQIDTAINNSSTSRHIWEQMKRDHSELTTLQRWALFVSALWNSDNRVATVATL